MRYPFEASFAELVDNIDTFAASVFSSLESEFLTMPKGPGFIEYPVFEGGYEALKNATGGFGTFSKERILTAVLRIPITFIVFRTILGLTPPEWAYLTSQRTGIEVTQGFARTLDRRVRTSPLTPLGTKTSTSIERLTALISTGCQLLQEGAPSTEPDKLHRLDKADTKYGLEGVRNLALMGTPYAMLLYERFLGRPFAGHRDSVSELVGDSLESAIEDVLTREGISYRKTKRAERIRGFDQAPDFMIPSEFNPQVIIEAKITEDDGTARDKVTRVQHLGQLSEQGQPPNRRRFEVVACIAGRGFGVRREDMRKLLLATHGKVFTPNTLGHLVECTRLKDFRSRA